MSFFVKFFICCKDTQDSQSPDDQTQKNVFDAHSFANLEAIDKKATDGYDSHEDSILKYSSQKKHNEHSLKPEAITFNLQISPSNPNEFHRSPEFSSAAKKNVKCSSEGGQSTDSQEVQDQSPSRYEPTTKSRFAQDGKVRRATTLKSEETEDKKTVAGFIKMNRIQRVSEGDDISNDLQKSGKDENNERVPDFIQRSDSKRKTLREQLNSTPILTSVNKKN